MGAYIVRRLLLMIPTLLAIMMINFMVIQIAPGGPIEQVISQLTGARFYAMLCCVQISNLIKLFLSHAP